MECDHQHSPSFRTKLKHSIICSSCCNSSDSVQVGVSKVLEPSDTNNRPPPPASLSTWIRSELPEIKDRCASLFSCKIGRNRHRGNSVEFGYDPLSYALNFEDDDSRIDEYPLRNFSARLPPSPPPRKKDVNVVVPREIAAWS